MSSPVVQLLTAAERIIDKIMGVYKDMPPTTHIPELVELGEQYKILFVTNSQSDAPELSFDRIDDVQAKIFVDLIGSELCLYPPRVIHDSKVERMVLCNRLHANNNRVAGLAAMGLFIVDTLFLDASDMTHGWDYARKAFHHELFHAIDYHDDIWRYLDTDWFHLNPQGFQYDRSLFKGFNEPCKRHGFVSTYAMTSIHEDKAEVYCNLIIDCAEVERRTKTDEVLERKVERMRRLLKHFNHEFDEEFWARIRERSKRFHPRTHSQWQRSQRRKLDPR